MAGPTVSTAPGQGGRPSLTPGMTTFVVVDVILVVTLLVLVVMQVVNAGGPTTPAPGQAVESSAAPESTPEQSAPPSPTDAAELTSFVLPSGNIYCAMTATSATCTIITFTFTAPKPPAGCAGTVGNLLEVTAGQDPTMPCVTTAPGPAPADTPVLEYGQASTVGEMTCHSSTNGATCRHNPSGKGFSIARGGYTFL
ncbi:MAG: hypothetical protein HGA44_04795 [Cellulomonadaceae bacterium]|nr:hypothetical protein [Cellulomonadaceae bacterium]